MNNIIKKINSRHLTITAISVQFLISLLGSFKLYKLIETALYSAELTRTDILEVISKYMATIIPTILFVLFLGNMLIKGEDIFKYLNLRSFSNLIAAAISLSVLLPGYAYFPLGYNINTSFYGGLHLFLLGIILVIHLIEMICDLKNHIPTKDN